MHMNHMQDDPPRPTPGDDNDVDDVSDQHNPPVNHQ